MLDVTNGKKFLITQTKLYIKDCSKEARTFSIVYVYELKLQPNANYRFFVAKSWCPPALF